jgi:hypothetical protein
MGRRRIPKPGSPPVDKYAAKEEAGGHEDGGGEERIGGEFAGAFGPFGKSANGEGESDVDEREERAMRVRESPKQAAGFVGDFQVGANFEAVKNFQNNSQSEIKK